MSNMPSKGFTFLLLLVNSLKKRAAANVQASARQEQINGKAGRLTADRLQAEHWHTAATE